MTKSELIEKLKELGVDTDNYYPKKSFIYNSEPYIGCYKSELLSKIFYFHNDYDKKIYKIGPLTEEDVWKLDSELFEGKTKYLVPLSSCEVIWSDKPYIELPDIPFKDATLRQYACIHLKVPNSGYDWLDVLIKESIQNDDKGRVDNNT